MLYVADLRRNGLLKVGITNRLNAERRRQELRRKLFAPKLRFISQTYVPSGWGGEREWEARLLKALRTKGGMLQLFSEEEKSEEVVDATPRDALRQLWRMLAETQVNPSLPVDRWPVGKVDWRFRLFWLQQCAESEYWDGLWRRPLNRWFFRCALLREPSVRSLREEQGYSCVEVDELLQAEWQSKRADRSESS